MKEITKVDDLETLTELKLVVNTSTQSLQDLGIILPKLEVLDLSGSFLASIRDLGVNLQRVIKLVLDDCSLSELDGMGAMQGLQILSLKNNYVSDVTPLAMLENLQVTYYNLLLIPVFYFY